MPVQNLDIEENQENGSGQINSNQRIIVIGGSTGGFEAFKIIVKNLPPDFNTPVFIVWHMSPDVRGILPDVLNRLNTIYAAHAYNNEEIKPNRIYVAPPDHHMLIEDGKILVTHGPKENRFRPAIDPLFRSAAYTYGNRVIGVILSGALDDGTWGLWTIKHHGGIAVVQNPNDAEVPSMPENALVHVQPDHCVPVADIAELLVRLTKEKLTDKKEVMKDDQVKKEIHVAEENGAAEMELFRMGELTPFTCPECHGVLAKFTNGNLSRFRCHTGHAYSLDTLMAAISETIEESLYSAIRGIDESIMLLNHVGDHFAEANNPKLAALYFRKAQEAKDRGDAVRKTVFSHEQLSKGSLQQEADEDNNQIKNRNAIKKYKKITFLRHPVKTACSKTSVNTPSKVAL